MDTDHKGNLEGLRDTLNTNADKTNTIICPNDAKGYADAIQHAIDQAFDKDADQNRTEVCSLSICIDDIGAIPGDTIVCEYDNDGSTWYVQPNPYKDSPEPSVFENNSVWVDGKQVSGKD